LNVSNPSFGVDQTNQPMSKGTDDQSPATSGPLSDRPDKIVVVCPHCQATLRVRRVYIGNPVRCKSCQQDFTVAVTPDAVAQPTADVTRNLAESPTQNHETEGEIRRLREEIDRVRTERNDLCQERDRLTIQLNEIRASLGDVAPAQVRPLVEERDSLRIQVVRLGDEIRDLRADQSAQALRTAELEGRVAELNTVRRELAVLSSKLNEREVELDSARSLHAGLSQEHQTAHEEVKALKATLDERDRAIERQADQHHAELESHVQALNDARQLHREALERHKSELVALGDRHERIQEEHQASEDLCTQLKAQILELEQAQERINSEYQSAVETARAQQRDEREGFTKELNEIRASLGEVTPAQVGLLVEERDSLRAQVLRLGDEIRAQREVQAAHSLLAAELEGRVEELDAARRELAVLGGNVKERDDELVSACALHAGLTRDHQAAIEEIKVLNATLEERDQAIQRQADEHIDRQRERAALERLEAELAAMGERHSRVGEELCAREGLCTQLQDRIVELEKAQETIKCEYQSMIDAERTKQKELTEQLLEQSAKLEKTGRSAEQVASSNLVPESASHDSNAALKSALAQVEDLKEWLAESERLNRDMAALLENIGIKFSPPARG
jgi:hypothetical protein